MLDQTQSTPTADVAIEVARAILDHVEVMLKLIEGHPHLQGIRPRLEQSREEAMTILNQARRMN